MKKLLKKIQKRRINNKRGLSLLELIIAVMLLMIVISMSLNALNISYRSVLIGAEKDNAQSIAQRDCDIVMAIISRQAENGTLADNIDPVNNYFTAAFFPTVQADTNLDVYASCYDVSQYEALQQQSITSADPSKKKRLLELTKGSRKIGTKVYTVYKVKVNVYYGTDNNEMYVSCEGEVNVEV